MKKLKRNIFVPIICIVLFFACLFFYTNWTTFFPKVERAAASEKTEKLSTIQDLQNASIDDIAALPKYDGRNYGIVTPVKNQMSLNLCWAFASVAVAESNILRNGFVQNMNKLSLGPKTLAYNMENRQDDPLNNTYESVASGNIWNVGRFQDSVPQLLTQWRGLVDSSNPLEYVGYDKTDYLLEKAIYVPAEVDAIKKAIAQYGAVTMSYKVDPLNRTFLYTKEKPINHTCTIVGWNDNIDKNLFGPTAAPINGGWIVKNSWGEGFFDNGYFYMSYDSYISNVVAFNFEEKTAYDNNYFYDCNTLV